MRIKKSGVISVCAVGAVLLAIYVGCNGKINIKLPAKEKMIGTEIDVEEDENKPSDIDGMTVGEKVSKGMRPEDGSDTDGDGLTDKEEVEIYHSDPTRRSTAGDFMTDKEKIEKGLDVNTKVEDNGDHPIDGPDGLVFHPENADGFAAEADDCGNTLYVKDGYSTVRSWTVKNFSGKLDIDLQKVAPEYVGKKNIHVLIGSWTGEDIKDVNAERKENTMSVNIGDDSEIYVVMLADRTGEKHRYKEDTPQVGVMPDYGENLIDSVGAAATGAISKIKGDIDEQVTGVGLVDYPYLFYMLAGRTPKCIYVPTGNDEVDNANRQLLLKTAKVYTDGDMDMDISVVKDVTYPEYLAELAKDKGWPFGENNHAFAPVTNQDFDIHRYLYLWCTLDDFGGQKAVIDPDSIKTEETPAGDKFNPKKDELPFGNISTAESPAGNCAGISILTIRHFMYGTLDKSGSYGKHTWSLSDAEENEPLLKRTVVHNLFNYKDGSFLKEHTKNDVIDESTLDTEEQQFINMVKAYQRLTNDTLHKAGRSYMYNDASVIDRIKKSIDAGRPVCIGVSRESKDKMYLHALVAFQYQTHGNETIFTMYDCNRPIMNENNEQVTNGMELLHTTEYTGKDGKKQFDYYYKVFDRNPYTSTNSGKYYFDAIDGDLNVLN